MNLSDKLQKCHEYIDKAQKIIIATHMNPDGDAIGSALALYHYLTAKGKEATAIIDSPVTYDLDFLEGVDKMHVFSQPQDHELIINADLIIIADLNNTKRLRSIEPSVIESKAKKIVIDHHIDPKDFADHYCVDTDACSTGEILWKLIDIDNDFKINRPVAEALYVAIMTDTGSFRFDKTDGEVHRIIGNLIDAGVSPSYVYDKIYNNMPVDVKRLNGIALSMTEIYCNEKLALISITKDIFEETGTSGGDVEGIVEQLLSIRGIKIGVLLTEIADKNEIRLSFRSKENYAVRDFAVELGGGGHINAAGARVKNGNIDELKEKIIKMACKIL